MVTGIPEALAAHSADFRQRRMGRPTTDVQLESLSASRQRGQFQCLLQNWIHSGLQVLDCGMDFDIGLDANALKFGPVRKIIEFDRDPKAHSVVKIVDDAARQGRLPVPRSSEYPAFRRDHWAMGRPLVRSWLASASHCCGQPVGESSHASCRP